MTVKLFEWFNSGMSIKDMQEYLYGGVFRDIAASFSKQHGTTITPVFFNKKVRDLQYLEGNKNVIVTTINNLNIVDEEELTWDQVFNFRKDKESQLSYKRLQHWLDTNMIGKSQTYVEDDINLKLYNYKKALDKHGIKTVIGTIEETLDSKFLIGTSIASSLPFALDSKLGILVGAGLVIGNIIIKLTKNRLEYNEIEQGPNSEISYLYKIGQL
jgi:hypothetical protein